MLQLLLPIQMCYPNHITCWNACCHYSHGAATTHVMQPLPTAATAAELTSYIIESYRASSKHNVFVMQTKGTKLTFYCPSDISMWKCRFFFLIKILEARLTNLN